MLIVFIRIVGVTLKVVKGNMKKKVCAETRVLARFYREYSGLSYRTIAAKCGISKTTAHRACGKQIYTARNSVRMKGRPKCLNERDYKDFYLDPKVLSTKIR